MTETSPRLRIAHVLLRLFARGTTTPADALQHLPSAFDADKRRVADDLKLLADAGLIEAVGTGRARHYVLPSRLRSAQRGLLDRIALALGRDHTRFLEGTSLANPLQAEDLTPPAAWRAADRLDRLFHFLGEPERSYRAHEDILDALVDGLVRSRELDLVYASGEQERRYPTAQPLTLVVYRRSVYLLMQDPTLEGARCLSVDRIQSATLGAPFDYPDDWQPKEHFADVFGVVAVGEAERITLAFPAEVAHLVAARCWHPSQKLEALEDGGVLLHMKARGSELVRFVLEWGRMCRVLKPAWLREAVQDEMKAALRGYEG